MPNFFERQLATAPSLGFGTAFTSYTFVNTTDQVEWVYQMADDPAADSTVITRLGYRLTSVTGTSPVMHISLQGVDANGFPDGVIKGAGNSAFATFTPAGTGTWNWITLGGTYTAQRGEFLATVIKYSSGTLNGSNTPLITMSTNAPSTGLPYAIQNVATVRTKQTNFPVYGVGSASKAFGQPMLSITNAAISTPNEQALRFIVEGTAAQFYTVAGISAEISAPAAGKVVKVMLYSGTTVLQTATIPANVWRAQSVALTVQVWFQDATLTPLAAGQEYRVSVAPQDATNNVALPTINVNAQADMEAYPGGQQVYGSTRATGGATAWSDAVTTRPLMQLIIRDWQAPPPGLVMAT